MGKPLIQPTLFDDVPQPVWIAPDVRGACGRDPAAGPGSCTYWWEGCPKADKRGCYIQWKRSRHE